jgi:hypothetical protein
MSTFAMANKLVRNSLTTIAAFAPSLPPSLLRRALPPNSRFTKESDTKQSSSLRELSS